MYKFIKYIIYTKWNIKFYKFNKYIKALQKQLRILFHIIFCAI